MVIDYLIENYDKGEPIFLTDININGMSEENLRYHLKKLTDDGVIGRFESGIYYIPEEDVLGEKAVVTADTVALHKYVLRKGKFGILSKFQIKAAICGKTSLHMLKYWTYGGY